MAKKIDKKERRPIELLREHYLIEKNLADRLRNASKQERHYLYSYLYDELFRRVPHHPQLTQKANPEERKREIFDQIKFLGRFLSEDTIFLEIGPGDCALSFEVSKLVKKVLAIDVSKEIANFQNSPVNFELILSDGSNIPLPPESIHVAYSNYLIEHLHPDDAVEQLRNIFKVLIPGGLYICVTANRLNGPHDISMFFEKVASGFHLKEYTNTELVRLFKSVGFSEIKAFVHAKGSYFRFPLFLITACELLLSLFPYSLRKAIALNIIFRSLLRIRLVGKK